MQLEAGQYPPAGVRLQAQHRRRCGPGRARRDPQRRVLVIRGRLHRRPLCPLEAAVVTRPSPGLPDRGRNGRMEGAQNPPDEGGRVTEPGIPTDVPDADRAEQEALLDPPAVTSAREGSSPGADVPEADALEQQLAARPGEAGSPLTPVGGREADEADVLEQETDVPLDDDEIPG